MRLTPFSFGHRWLAVDALRGVACVWMAVYHFCFDLRVFGWQPDWNFYSDPFWTSQRTAILSTFLLCAGIGQGIASAQGQNWQRFWRRCRGGAPAGVRGGVRRDHPVLADRAGAVAAGRCAVGAAGYRRTLRLGAQS